MRISAIVLDMALLYALARYVTRRILIKIAEKKKGGPLTPSDYPKKRNIDELGLTAGALAATVALLLVVMQYAFLPQMWAIITLGLLNLLAVCLGILTTFW